MIIGIAFQWFLMISIVPKSDIPIIIDEVIADLNAFDSVRASI